MEKNDMVKVEYTAKFETGEVIETSNEETAKETGIYDAKKNYKPLVVRAGAGHEIRGFDEALLDMEKGEEKKTIIPPEKGYGEINQDKIKKIPKHLFLERDIVPKKGKVIRTVQGYRARITNVSGDSVELDFNHKLAGKTLVFIIKILDIQKK
ncbi:MAG: peptidylprolyl isomerase [Candidatus Hydrothermarchaeales archaeon]